MTEQNDNKQVFNKDDAKKALKTLTTFGLQQGSKLANFAGEKMTKWSKQVGQKLDAVRDHHEDDDGPLSGDVSVKSLSDFIKRAAYNKDIRQITSCRSHSNAHVFIISSTLNKVR